MSRNPNLKEKYLDGEKLFKRYIEMGEARSVYLLCEYAILEGMISSKGQQPTPMGCWKAMWRWVSVNKDVAWNYVKGATFGTKHNLHNLSYNEWVKDMVKTKIPSAWQHTTHAKRDKFLRENGWIS